MCQPIVKSELFRTFAGMKMLLPIFLVLWLLVTSCGGGKKDAAYYEQKIYSIRKAEQLKELRKTAGVFDEPIDVFFDTIQVRPLPIRSAGANIGKIGHFCELPPAVISTLGYPVETPLKLMKLPRANGFMVVMIAEQQDSVPPIVYLKTLDARYQTIDQLCIYEQKAEERGDDFGLVYNDYYITSDWEITLMYAFLRDGAEYPHVENTRRYVINADGYFEEVMIEL